MLMTVLLALFGLLVVVSALCAWLALRAFNLLDDKDAFNVRKGAVAHVRFPFALTGRMATVLLVMGFALAVGYLGLSRVMVSAWARLHFAESLDVPSSTLSELGYGATEARLVKLQRLLGEIAAKGATVAPMDERDLPARFVTKLCKEEIPELLTKPFAHYVERVVAAADPTVAASHRASSAEALIVALALAGDGLEKPATEPGKPAADSPAASPPPAAPTSEDRKIVNRYLRARYSPEWSSVAGPVVPSADEVLRGLGDFDVGDPLARAKLQRNIERALADEKLVPLQKLVSAVLDRTGEGMSPFFRALNTIGASVEGYIQFITFVLYFWALGLLVARRRILQLQDHDVRTDFFKWAVNQPPATRALFPGDTPFDWGGEVPSKDYAGRIEAFVLHKAQVAAQDPAEHALPKRGSLLLESMVRLSGMSDRTEIAARIHDICEQAESRLARVEYSLIEFAIWAMPTFGFIGTVIGIGQALGFTDRVVTAQGPHEQADAIGQVTTLLAFAFDTTLIALVCGVPVMLWVNHLRAAESRFLLSIERRVREQLHPLPACFSVDFKPVQPPPPPVGGDGGAAAAAVQQAGGRL